MDGKSKCSSCCPNFTVYVQVYFLTVAYDIATGILGLPVALARSGLPPFIVHFTICAIMQFLIVNLVTDVLQKCVAVQLKKREECATFEPRKMLNKTYNLEQEKNVSGKLSDPDESSVSDNESRDNESGDEKFDLFKDAEDESLALLPGANGIRQPDLNLLGAMFMPKWFAALFIIHSILTFTFFATTHTLAGGQAYAQLLNARLIVVVPFFCWILNPFVLFGRRFIQPVISILTIFKALILIVTVICAFIVGSFIDRRTTTNFNFIMDSFLLGTTALGGVPVVMPYMYGKIGHEACQIRAFRLAVNLGIFTCYVLDTLYCWSILDVVPQIDPCIVKKSTNMYQNVTISSSICLPPGDTLLSAKDSGEISTIPFTEVIHSLFPQFDSVSVIITVFIIVSVTVAYTITTTALCHTVDGVVCSLWDKMKWKRTDLWRGVTKETITQTIAGVVFLAIIFTIAMTNPNGFIKLVEKVMSFANNTAAGVFMYAMVWKVTHTEEYRSLPIPLPLTKVEDYLQYLVPIYFNFAAVYDIVTWILESAGVQL